MAGQGSAEPGANRERSVKKCEPTKVPACGGRLCLPDSRGAGAGRMPPLLGRPEGQNEMAVDLVFKRAAFRQNEMAVDLKTLTSRP